MNIVKYQMLIKAAEMKSITKAATALGYTQSALSRSISDLEAEWGFPVIVRRKSNLTLTADGEELIHSLRQIIKWNENLMQTVSEINGLRTGLVRIGSFESVAIDWIPRIVKSYIADYPNINFEVAQGIYDDIGAWVRDDIIDCGFTVERYADGYDFIPLISDPYRVVLPPDNDLRSLDVFPVSKLGDFPFIVPGEGMAFEIGSLLKSASIKPNIRYSTENDFVTLSFVENGLGISILPQLVLKNYTGNVCAKELDCDFSRTIGIVVKDIKYAHPATKLFIEYTKAYINNLP